MKLDFFYFSDDQLAAMTVESIEKMLDRLCGDDPPCIDEEDRRDALKRYHDALDRKMGRDKATIIAVSGDCGPTGITNAAESYSVSFDTWDKIEFTQAVETMIWGLNRYFPEAGDLLNQLRFVSTKFFLDEGKDLFPSKWAARSTWVRKDLVDIASASQVST